MPSFRLLLLFTGLCGGGLSSFAQRQTEPAFSQIIVFADSFSDTGNVRDRTHAATGGLVDFPGITFNYGDGRYTNSNDTNPSSTTYAGVWHEQLARIFLNAPVASHSLGGGTDYAFGGATTENGTRDETVVITPFGDVTITIDNMGKQMDDYLAGHAVAPGALYIIWGGTNDLVRDDSAMSVTAAAARATALVGRLANVGAENILVPNLPPLGDVPGYSGDPAQIASLNAASANYRMELNADLTSLLSSLALLGITPTVYRLDIWTNTIRIFSDGPRYGFTNTTEPAQGNSSANPDQFAFWDTVPSQHRRPLSDCESSQ